MNKVIVYQIESTKSRFEAIHNELLESFSNKNGIFPKYLSDVNFLYWSFCEQLEDFLSSNSRE